MNVLLLYFDLGTGYFPGLHHGLAYIAGSLSRHKIGFQFVHIKDSRSWDLALEMVQRHPRILGLSFVTNQLRHAKRFVQNIRNKDFLLLAGGVHSTISGAGLFREIPELDGICMGEGENAFVELAQRVIQGREFRQTPGFLFSIGGKVIQNAVSAVDDLEALPLPDYSIFDVAGIVAKSGSLFHMMLGRGCPFDCSYCCNPVLKRLYPDPAKYVRTLSAQKAIDLIRHNLRFAPTAAKIDFEDDTFTLNKAWLKEFCALYKAQVRLPFLCNARVETIDPETLGALKDAGCFRIAFGVESGNEWLRANVLNRRHSNAKIRETFNLTSSYGLSTFSYNIFGLPFETERMMKDTLKLNQLIRPSFGRCFYFFPYPGSRLYDLCKEYNFIDEPSARQVSGYLERPVIKPTFASQATVLRRARETQLYFYLRLASSKVKMPRWLEVVLFPLVNLFRAPIMAVLGTSPDSRVVRKLRSIPRRLSLACLRQIP